MLAEIGAPGDRMSRRQHALILSSSKPEAYNDQGQSGALQEFNAFQRSDRLNAYCVDQ
jgi:hypothetical protein